MINNREISLWLFCLIMSISLFSFSQKQFQFQENKGQLPNSVFSKVKVPGGSVFIEKGKFLYSFYNSKQLQERHDLIRKERWIDAHSFSATFLIVSDKTCLASQTSHRTESMPSSLNTTNCLLLTPFLSSNTLRMPGPMVPPVVATITSLSTWACSDAT